MTISAGARPHWSFQAHPDFIILRPQRGLLVLEVKDLRMSTIQSINNHEATIFAIPRKNINMVIRNTFQNCC